MMSHSLPEIDFHQIRTCRGTRYGGFEELTVSLFRVEVGKPFEIRRVEGSGGDGGLEAFLRRTDDAIVGVQSKYFRELKDRQWKQIEKSIQQAKKNHPKLRLYYVATPLDRTPQALTRWKALELKWRGKVKLLWWGHSEIIHLLTQSAHHGRLRYWFGAGQFENSWLDRLNRIAVNDLDTRYTPARHVRTESEDLLDSVAMTEAFIRRYSNHLHALMEAARSVTAKLDQCAPGTSVEPRLKQLLNSISSRLPVLSESRPVPRMAEVIEICSSWRDQIWKVWGALDEVQRAASQAGRAEAQKSDKDPFSYERELIRRFLQRVEALEEFAGKFECADYNRVLVLGPAGAGKSHLLANLVRMARDDGQPALMLLGEYFLSPDEPWDQLAKRIGWEGTINEFFAAMHYAAEIAERPALLCIDALNESADRRLWKSHLQAFAARLADYPNIRLIVSCRDDFAELTLPLAISEHREPAWARIAHAGFGENVFEAVASYFSGYQIQARHFPPILPEFQNPLFLKTFCEAFENSSLPEGTITLSTVMEARLRKVCAKLLQDIDCPEDITRQAISVLAEMVENASGQSVPRMRVRPLIDALFPGKGEFHSLYRHLCSNGLIVEVTHYSFDDSPPLIVARFPFERFSEYFIANRMLQQHPNFGALQIAWSQDGTHQKFVEHGGYGPLRGLARAMAILVPERFGEEFMTLFPEGNSQDIWLADFLASLVWRSSQSFTSLSTELLERAREQDPTGFMRALLAVATIPGHPYNAKFLHQWLAGMDLPARELTWTIRISRPYFSDSAPSADMIIRWAFLVPLHLVSDEQAALVTAVLIWLCASNWRALRFRATLAAIRVLTRRATVAAEIVKDFSAANDPYVVERAYAVAAGVAMRDPDDAGLRGLAANVFSSLFQSKSVQPNIVVRDFGRCVVEIANQRGVLPAGIDIARCRPPYRSSWPKIWTEKRVQNLEKTEGWYSVAGSVRPEGNGWMYGDFGRYEMQSAVHNFSSVHLGSTQIVDRKTRDFDALIARRWVIQRVAELGWNPERFGLYEQGPGMTHGRQRVDVERWKLERISKKYQWIALQELLGYLSDHYKMAVGWNNDPGVFAGPWQCYARDFDPSQPLHDLQDDAEDAESEISTTLPWWQSVYPDPFLDTAVCAKPNAWVRHPPADFRPLLEWKDPYGLRGEYLVLNGFYSWKEPPASKNLQPRPGELRQWSHVRTWLVRQKDFASTLEAVKKMQFWGEGCHLIDLRSQWLGTYPWGQEHENLMADCAEPDRWVRNDQLPIEHAAVQWNHDDVAGLLPSPRLLKLLHARWTGRDFEFCDAVGNIVTFAPFDQQARSLSPFFVNKRLLISALRTARWKIIWGVVGDRSCFDFKSSNHISDAEMQFSAVYWLDGNDLMGGLTKMDVVPYPKRGNNATTRASKIEAILTSRRRSTA